jgi:malonyl CoA-acyl carrier protein transacylase
MEKFRIIVCTPPALADPSIAIAGSRAGALGVLDLEYILDVPQAVSGIEKLAQFARKRWGVKLDGDREEFLAAVLSKTTAQPDTIIFTYPDQTSSLKKIPHLKSHGYQVLLEATSLEEAAHGEKAGADGIIAKGHEAGGRVGNETSFILLQRVLKHLDLPIYAQGGIGLHTAAACYSAGVAGIVLDSQLALTRESSIPVPIKTRIAAMDGTQTICLGEGVGCIYRVWSHLGISEIKKLQETERSIVHNSLSQQEKIIAWGQAIADRVGWDPAEDHVFLLGQDVAFAAPLAERFVTVGGIVEGIRREVEDHIRVAGAERMLAEGSPLALSHRTRYPIVQGPMARISDTPRFIHEVAQHGALPFLAAAWLRGEELETMLRTTRELLKDLAWGVGMLGFLPPDIYKEQMKAVIAHRPPFALIGGGQAGQVKALEKEGIATYVHVPSPGLLKMFLDEGVKRFVFEGRESGGHIGPLCGFALWETMIRVLLEHLTASNTPQGYHVLFAGGIHDALSASMVATMAAPLADRSVCAGVQMGSAYLFTEEAVATGAIVKKYQQEAIRCAGTTVLWTGPGDEERCIDNPFAKTFIQERCRLQEKGVPLTEIQETLNRLKRGRLRIAAKGLARNPDQGGNPDLPKLQRLGVNDQYDQGTYLIGQLAGLHEQPTSIDNLHREILRGSKVISSLTEAMDMREGAGEASPPSDIAIIGMGGFFPRASNIHAFWENVLNKVNAVQEIPPRRWDWRQYYDKDRNAKDRIYSKWGTFLDDVPFDPLQYGMPPMSLSSIEPLHLLTLEAVRSALEDAGYARRPFHRERTSVVLGVSGVGDLAQGYGFRTSLPSLFGKHSDEILSRSDGPLPRWTEDSFPGILANVAAGRVANRFNLGGLNCTVDAACASSLAAVHLAVRELETGSSDMVVVGGADCMQNPFTYMCFSKTQALSPTGHCKPLDENADGIVLGEAVAVLILKRLADAEKDGDRIYAVIRGVGASSDGRDRSLTAPGKEGQVRALRRAYKKARFSPAHVELIEAHATGTPEGDRVEIESLSQVFQDGRTPKHTCAIGSIKSMIGHTKSTAGIASLTKATLALYYKVLPPTLGVNQPIRSLRVPDSPFYVNPESHPWLRSKRKYPRKAGVSAFGFGGTNYHVALEEYDGGYLDHLQSASFRNWPTELFFWHGESRQEVLEFLSSLNEKLPDDSTTSLSDLAFALYRSSKAESAYPNGKGATMAIVASSLLDLKKKIQFGRQTLADTAKSFSDPRGIYFCENHSAGNGKIAFLFPGQGSQYPHMLRELAIQFPVVREVFEKSDGILEDRLERPLSSSIFPHASYEDSPEIHEEELSQTRIAQPAMGAAGLAMFHLLRSFGIQPDMLAGHSYGEYVALCVSGVLSEEELIDLSEARARFMLEAAGTDPGAMAAVEEMWETVADCLEDMEGVWIANVNGPKQTVVSGTKPGIQSAIAYFRDQNIQARRIPVTCAFHSPMLAPACDRLKEYLSGMQFAKPMCKVFSNTTADTYPDDPEAIKELLARHLTSKVEFVEEIKTMYNHGARIFIEVGPGRVVTGLIDQILHGLPHLALVSNQAGSSGLTQLNHLIAQLIVHGVSVDVERLYQGRGLQTVEMGDLWNSNRDVSPTTWLVNGTRVRPATEEKISPAGTEPLQTDPFPDLLAIAQHAAKQECGINLDHTERDGDEVMLRFQRLMQQFLETQRSVMAVYVKGQGDATSKNRSMLPIPHDTSGKYTGESVLMKDMGEIDKPASEESWERELLGDRESAVNRLLQLVSERTGYPEEMLGMNVDLEADLGIDSIKRVEILGQFVKMILPGEVDAPPELMESIKSIKTLQDIIDRIPTRKPEMHKKKHDIQHAPFKYPIQKNKAVQRVAGDLPRFTVGPVPIPPPSLTAALTPHKVAVIFDDGTGAGKALVERLRHVGQPVAVIRWQDGLTEVGEHVYTLMEISESEVARVIQSIRSRQGPIGGVIHLFSLKTWNPYEEMDRPDWGKRLETEAKSLFLSLRAVGKDLQEAAEEGGAYALAATAMGGTFGMHTEGPRTDFSPGQGSIHGLLKTVALEWPEVRVKALDLSLVEPPRDLADHILAELQAEDSFVEVGYAKSQRFSLGVTEAPLPVHSENELGIDSSWVILATGGARGITAKVVLQLARRYTPTLILAGRSPLPLKDEPPDTAHLTEAAPLKRALLSRMKSQVKEIQLVDVEAAYHQLQKDREIRKNLTDLKQLGSRVEYVQLDVRDAEALGQVIDGIYRRYGRLDGVIHGAGIIEDKLLQDKSWESFDRVFGTKTDSVYALSKKLRSESLRFLALFSSVAGCFGNVGQCDYTAANEVMNKLACYLDQRWPARVLSINWGPWSGGGMATEEVQRQFAERGVPLVHPQQGADAFERELQKGSKGDAEVILGDGPWKTFRPPQEPRHETVQLLPSLQGCQAVVRKDESWEIIKRLDTSYDLYLLDHRLDGKPVLPATMAIEMMGEAALQGRPGWKVAEICDVRVLKGIVLKENTAELRIIASPRRGAVRDPHILEIETSIEKVASPGVKYYSANTILRRSFPQPPAHPFPGKLTGGPFWTSPKGAYEAWLFHGPRFQCIEEILAISEQGMAATLLPSSPRNTMAVRTDVNWVLDPVVVDGGLQLALLWARNYLDITILPSHFERICLFGPLQGTSAIRCHFHLLEQFRGQSIHSNLLFWDPKGSLLCKIEGFEATGSTALNRLGGSHLL